MLTDLLLVCSSYSFTYLERLHYSSVNLMLGPSTLLQTDISQQLQDGVALQEFRKDSQNHQRKRIYEQQKFQFIWKLVYDQTPAKTQLWFVFSSTPDSDGDYSKHYLLYLGMHHCHCKTDVSI